MTYDFQTKLAEGQRGESLLDLHFTRWYGITPATDAEQRKGIDRWFTDGKRRIAVEYKTDARAAKTHNAFVETVSVSTTGKQGWAYTSRADILIYYVPGDDLIYIIDFVCLRAELPRWAAKYPVREIPNKGYTTLGLLVPLHEFERLAKAVHSL